MRKFQASPRSPNVRAPSSSFGAQPSCESGWGRSFGREPTMYRHLRALRKACLGLLALAALGAMPATAAAGSMGFRNDLNIPIVVQGESVINGVLQRGHALLIAPRKCAYDT